MNVRRERDVLVVGGGPAGLAAAIHAARRGLAVSVCDARRPPIDKACGEGLLGDGAAALERLGVDTSHLGRRLVGIRYLAGDAVAEARFPADREGMGVRRIRLHAALTAAAEAAGVELAWGCRVDGLSRGGVTTGRGELPSRFVVGADGLHSRVRRWAGLAGRPARRRRFGLRRHYRVMPWSDCVEVYWAVGCEAYVTPVGDDEVGVAFLWQTPGAGFDDFLARVPALAARLAGARPVSRERGSGPFEQRARGVFAGRVALVGDAAGYVDALTGEGLGIALREAEALAAALAAEDPAAYARDSRRIRRRPERLARLLLAVDAMPMLRRRLVPYLAAWPRVMARFLALLAGEASVVSAPSSRSDPGPAAAGAAADRGRP